MGPKRTRACLRRSLAAASVVLGTLGLAVGVPSAGALARSVAAPYSCSTQVLGMTHTLSLPMSVSGATPAKVAPGAKVTMSGWQLTVTVPASLVNEFLRYGVNTLSGRLTNFTIASTNSTGAVNAAGKGIPLPHSPLQANTPVTVKLPSTPKAIGTWTAGTAGTMTFRTGKALLTFSGLGAPVPVTCLPKPSTTISHTTVA